jgi:anti-sigma factor RsiW
MNCREFTEFLNLYFDGELSAAERAIFDEHLAVCPDCTAYLQNYAATVRLGRAAFEGNGAVPADVPADLVTAVLKALGRQ